MEGRVIVFRRINLSIIYCLYCMRDVLIEQMRKKYSGSASKQKQSRIIKQRRCSMCLPSQVGLTHALQHLNLHKKYYYPQIQTYHYRSSNNLIYDAYSREAIQLNEINKIVNHQEMLSKYNSFSSTVQQIKVVIHRRVEKDFYGWVDFEDEHYTISNNYYIRRKHLIQNNKKMQKYLKNTHSMQSTGTGDDKLLREYFQNKIKKELDNQRLVKLADNNDTNSSTIHLQKLTRQLENMIHQIADLSVLPYQNKTIQRKKGGGGGGEINISLLFKLNNCPDISAIDKNKEDIIVPKGFDQPNQYQQSYGLQTIKPKNQGKGKKMNKLSLRSIDKINGFDDKLSPQTPKLRFSGDNQYEQVEFNSPTTWKTPHISRKKIQTPMSPGNNSSSSLKNSKTLSKSGSQSSVKKIK